MVNCATIHEIWKDVQYWAEYIIIIPVVIVIFIILLEKRRPSNTLAWIMTILLIPVAGLILFYFFGKNYRRKKTFTRKEINDLRQTEKMISWQTSHLHEGISIDNSKILEKNGVIKLLLNNSKALLTYWNKVTILNNGDQTFPAIFSALQEAKHHIHLEYYMIEEGEISRQLKEILIDKARKGIEIRLIYDGVGSWGISKKYVNDLIKAGVDARAFIPIRFPRLAQRFNFRNHRKIAIIDGKTGFIGGLNIADRYMYGTPEIGFWRDTHLKIEGTAVSSLQVVFLTDWYFVTNKLLYSTDYFPKTESGKKTLVQISTSGPDSDWDSIMQAFFYAITTSQQYIYISTPYFIPNESILTAIKTVALSGVDVRIILPSKSDSKLTYYGSMSNLKELLEANVGIYMYKKGFTHSKLLIVDDILSSVGSANMDLRSFDQNFEVNALIYDEDIARQLKNSFLDDIVNCEVLTLDNYNKRAMSAKIAEGVAKIFSPIL